jgi:hypothetical protein
VKRNQRKHTPIPLLAEYLAYVNRGCLEKHARALSLAQIAEAFYRASERKGGGR